MYIDLGIGMDVDIVNGNGVANNSTNDNDTYLHIQSFQPDHTCLMLLLAETASAPLPFFRPCAIGHLDQV